MVTIAWEDLDLSPACFGLSEALQPAQRVSRTPRVQAWSDSGSTCSSTGLGLSLQIGGRDATEAEVTVPREELDLISDDGGGDDVDVESNGGDDTAHRGSEQRGSWLLPSSAEPIVAQWGEQIVRGRVLGHGASAVVYAARRADGSTLAAKMFWGGDSRGWQALVAEAKLAMQLEHPAVIAYLGIGRRCLAMQLEHPAVIAYLGIGRRGVERYVLMELAEGGSVRAQLDEIAGPGGRLCGFDVARVQLLTRQALSGVCYLHARGVVHRDMKGANLLLRRRRESLLLGDFGSSTSLRLDKGTPFWMAPEVIGGSVYGRKADIWSVGCAVLEMLTGVPPWSMPEREGVQMNVFTVMCRIVTSGGPPPMPAWLPADARDFLLR
ncbi:kinase-like domain-containing protein [Pavlovales sp. CCMP2436]|nr:kinase-like domain-containing protein [Pavlovales sp. CCMP2436]